MTLFFGLLGVVCTALAASLVAVAARTEDSDARFFAVLFALVLAGAASLANHYAGQERAVDILHDDGYAVELDAHGQSLVGVMAATPKWVDPVATPEPQR